MATARPYNALAALSPDNSSGAITPSLYRDMLKSFLPRPIPAANYNFAALPASLTGGTLTASAQATITFTSANPCPWGVNHDDVAHYLYVSGGSGTAEAVLITGGTAVSGDSSGTITFTPANNHSGAYSIISATAGVAEASLEHPAERISFIGNINWYAPWKPAASANPGIVGAGRLFSNIFIQYTAGDGITLSHNQVFLVQDLAMRPAVAEMTAGKLINNSAPGTLFVERCYIGDITYNAYSAIESTGSGSAVYIRDTYTIAHFRGVGLTSAYFVLDGLHMLSGHQSVATADSCALYLSNIAGGHVGKIQHDGGALAYGMILDTTGTNVNEIRFGDVYLDNWTLAGIWVKGTGGTANILFGLLSIVDDNASYESLYGVHSTGFGILSNAQLVKWGIAGGNITTSYGYCMNIAGGVDGLTLDGVKLSSNKNGEANAGIVIADSVAAVKHIHITGGEIGTGENDSLNAASLGFFNGKVGADDITISGTKVDALAAANRITLLGSETNVSIDAPNIRAAAKSVAAAATMTFPVMNDDDVIEITGATAIATAVAGLREGQRITAIWTNGSPGAISSVATIRAGAGWTPTRYKPYTTYFTGGIWYPGTAA